MFEFSNNGFSNNGFSNNGMNNKKLGSIVMGLVLVLSLTSISKPSEAGVFSFEEGDLVVGVASGLFNVYDQTGFLKLSIDCGDGFTTGGAFDDDGNFYGTMFTSSTLCKVDTDGVVLDSSFGGPYSSQPESIVFDGAGNYYVGHATGDRDIKMYDADGNFTESFDVATERISSDWIDLDTDQCTMYYTSEGFLVMRYDVCDDTQLADFATLDHTDAFALRLLPGGELLVADSVDIHRLAVNSSIIKTYDADGENRWFSLNLDPDGTSFWSGDFITSNIYKFDIESGDELTDFNTGTGTNTVFGITIAGEITVAREICGDGIDNDKDGEIDEGCDVGGDVNCNLLEPTIVGTSGNDIINGTSAADIIHGLGGNDTTWLWW